MCNPNHFLNDKFCYFPTGVEALIGAYLSSGGQSSRFIIMRWIGMDIDFIDAPMQRHFIVNAKKLVNVRHFEITATLQVS